MKYIDPKSLTIGVLAASLVFACTDSNNKTTNSPSLVSEANAATGTNHKWDERQEWKVKAAFDFDDIPAGWEPFAVTLKNGNTFNLDYRYHLRKRIK